MSIIMYGSGTIASEMGVDSPRGSGVGLKMRASKPSLKNSPSDVVIRVTMGEEGGRDEEEGGAEGEGPILTMIPPEIARQSPHFTKSGGDSP
jgi:hypothetical protein